MKIPKITNYGDVSFEELDLDGTFFVGAIKTSYEKLVQVFGAAIDGEYKTDKEWQIHTPVGIATIYNWKNGKNYCGDDGLEVEDITDWSIRGNNKNIVAYVHLAVYK